MLLDNFFTIGKSHQICEDYALIDSGNIPHMIISDGCSSSRNTDIGARILARSLHNVLKGDIPGEDKIPLAYFQAKTIANSLGIDKTALDCTLLYAYILNSRIYIKGYGDGVLIIKLKNGVIKIGEINYKQNAPFYPSYLEKDRERQWKENFPDNEKIINYYRYRSMSEIFYTDENISYNQSLEYIDMVMLASDGISSIVNVQNGEKVPLTDVVTQMLNIKIRNGEYLKRRMKKMLEMYHNKDCVNLDDISVVSFIND